jgi:serine/threonine protein kinase/tetratricopeptide (TPR) repeat protein
MDKGTSPLDRLLSRFPRLSEADQRRLGKWLEDFEEGWSPQHLARTAADLPGSDTALRRPVLYGTILLDIRRRWKSGRPIPVEQYVQQFPELAAEGRELVGLLKEEFDIRIGLGHSVSVDQYVGRFPKLASAIRNWTKPEAESNGDDRDSSGFEVIEPGTSEGLDDSDDSNDSDDSDDSDSDESIEEFATPSRPEFPKDATVFGDEPAPVPSRQPTQAPPPAPPGAARADSVESPPAPVPAARNDSAEPPRLTPAPSASAPTTTSAKSNGSPPSSNASLSRDPLTGELCGDLGRYRIVRQLGQGGMGTVYLAIDNTLNRQIALKVPNRNDESLVGASMVATPIPPRIQQEARAAADLHHRSICAVYDVCSVANVHFITMEYVEGVPLSQRLKGNKWMPVGEAVRLIRTVAQALAYAHENGVVHRDIKPANIMIRTNGEPVVMDFGLARRSDEDGPRVTADGQVIGTMAYMPPEQLSGDLQRIGPHSDVYSLCCVLYETLTGHLPFDGKPVEIILKINSEDPRPLGDHQPHLVGSPLDAVIQRGMAKKTSVRYRTMVEFDEALAAASPKVVPETERGERRADPNTLVRPRPSDRTASRPIVIPSKKPVDEPKPAPQPEPVKPRKPAASPHPAPVPQPLAAPSPVAPPKPPQPSWIARGLRALGASCATCVSRTAKAIQSLWTSSTSGVVWFLRAIWTACTVSTSWVLRAVWTVVATCAWSAYQVVRALWSLWTACTSWVLRLSLTAKTLAVLVLLAAVVGVSIRQFAPQFGDQMRDYLVALLQRDPQPPPPPPPPPGPKAPTKAEIDASEKLIADARARANGDPVGARQDLSFALKEAPDNLRRAKAVLERARVDLDLTDYASARIDADQALKFDASVAVDAALVDAEASRQLWDFRASLSACIVAGSDANRALAYILREDWKSANDAVDLALRTDPTDPTALLGKASLVFFRDHDATGADRILSEAIALAPGNPSLRILRARVRTKLRNFDDAIRDCDDAARLWRFGLEPHVVRIQTNLAGNRAKGINVPIGADIEGVLRLDSIRMTLRPESNKSDTPAELTQIATLYRLKHDLDRALKLCDQAIDLQPNAVPGLLVRAGIQVERRNFKFAVDDCNKVLELCPENARALDLLARVSLADNDLNQAIQYCRRAAQSEPRFVPGMLSQSEIHLRRKEYPEAIKLCDAGLQIEPFQSPLYINRALAKTATGDRDGAIGDYDKATLYDPLNASAYNSRALLYVAKDDFKKALQDFNDSIAQGNNSEQVYRDRGEAYRELGQFELSLRDWRKADKIRDENLANHPKTKTP